MDNAIFEMQVLRKIWFSPTSATNNAVDWESMDTTDIRAMDILMFQEKRDRYNGYSKTKIVSLCTSDVKLALFPRDQELYRNISDEQISILLELMTCYLLQCKSFQSDSLLDLLVYLSVFLLASNKKQESEVWIREHLSELASLRNTYGTSILHKCMNYWMYDNLPKEPLVRLLVEEGKMDVNVVNTALRETPLHFLSRGLCFAEVIHGQFKTFKGKEDMMNIAEILINNGAHMDAVDKFGREASHVFSQRCPQWSFNVSLKCLAARALVKHGVRYEKHAPALLIPFIESHKPKDTKR